MVHKPRRSACRATVAGKVLMALLAMLSAGQLPGQAPPVHYQHAGSMPPGAIGRQQLMRGGPLPGYFQPVEIAVPQGAQVSTAATGVFAPPQAAPIIAGMLIGQVYRLRVTNIPQQPGLEVYPTIEVINRLYPPLGNEGKFPIPVDITQEEIELALSGKFVTRVIYLEEPEAALGVAENPQRQTYFEVTAGENPLDVADRMGRPMAILRLGGRVPEPSGPDQAFLFGSPALLRYGMRPKPVVVTPPPAKPAPQAAPAEADAPADLDEPVETTVEPQAETTPMVRIRLTAGQE